jgi:predicted metal-dependent peptidase
VLRQSASWWRGAVPKKTALRQYLDTFFGGSLARMMTALDAESSFSDDEVEALTAEIERLRKERKRS